MQLSLAFPQVPFTAADAVALGIGEHRLKSAVDNGEIVRVLRGVYVRDDIELSALVRAQAAALVISPHAVVCDRTAAWVHGVDTFRYAELDIVPPLETFVLRGHRATDRPECDGGSRDLRPSDWTIIGGVRVTTPIRTALDLGCKLSRRGAVAAMDALMRQHAFTVADLRRELPRYFRRRGVIQLRQLVPLVDGRAESAGESWTRLEIVDHGLPVPEPQWWIDVDGRPTYRLDLAYPRARVVVEYDGEEFHTSADDQERDRMRREWLRDHGWTVIVVNKDSFTFEAAAAWVRELRIALGLIA